MKVSRNNMSENLSNDLQALNLQFLMIFREYARTHPTEAVWKFDSNESTIKKIVSMPIDQLKELAGCGRAVLTILPTQETISNAPLNILAALAEPINSGNKKGHNA